ncbi:MAG TPA: L-threonylcarbamoyladenylate synthase [Thermoanaerobaculia bacterium]|nr:L-threonylcarbamoyladenylate synthase [Thermoanaerobaculia bacterium]
MTRIERFGEAGPDAAQKAIIAEILQSGGLAILPTDTIYGIHCVALDERAVSRLVQAKQRPVAQPLVVLASGVDSLTKLGVVQAARWAEALGQIWPAPLTAILPITNALPPSAGRRTLAIRVPDLAWLREIIATSGPLASSSVNLSGERAIYSTKEIPREVLDSIDLVCEQGVLEARASTIVDFTEEKPRVVREGDFLFRQKLWKMVWKSL